MKFIFFFITCTALIDVLVFKRLSALNYDYSLSSFQIALKDNRTKIFSFNNRTNSLQVVSQKDIHLTINSTLFKFTHNSKIVNLYNNKCLDVIEKNNAKFRTCDDKADNQKWKITNNKLVNINLGKCIKKNGSDTIVSNCNSASEIILNDYHIESSFLEISTKNDKVLSKDLLLKIEDTLNQLTDKIIDTSQRMNAIDKNYTSITEKIALIKNGNNNSFSNVEHRIKELEGSFLDKYNHSYYKEKVNDKINEFNNIVIRKNKQDNTPSNVTQAIKLFDLARDSLFGYFAIQDSMYSKNGPSHWKKVKKSLIDTSGIGTNSNITGSIIKLNKPLTQKENQLVNITLHTHIEFNTNKNSFFTIDLANSLYSLIFYTDKIELYNRTKLSNSIRHNKQALQSYNISLLYYNNNIEVIVNNVTLSSIESKENSFSFGINNLKSLTLDTLTIEKYTNKKHSINPLKSNTTKIESIKEENNFEAVYSYKTKCYATQDEGLCNYLFNFIRANNLKIEMIGTVGFKNQIYHSCIDKIQSHIACNDIMLKLMPILTQFEHFPSENSPQCASFAYTDKSICLKNSFKPLVVKDKKCISTYCALCCNGVAYGNSLCSLCPK